MYERFTDHSRRVMQIANREAQRFGHEYVGTEHILLGLIRDGDGVAANVLKNLNVDRLTIRMEIEKIIQSGPPAKASVEVKFPLTPRSKMVVEFAVDEARLLGNNYVGTEHLLIGLIREPEGVASQVLVNLGLTAAKIRHEVKALLESLPAEPDPPVVRDASESLAPAAGTAELPADVADVVADLARRIETANSEKQLAVSSMNFEWAAVAREREANLTRARDAILREWQPRPPDEPSAS